MQTLNADTTATGRFKSAINRHADTAEALASPGALEINWKGWQSIIDECLIDWAKEPQQLEDEGIDAPSLELIFFALDLAAFFRDQGWAAPQRVVPSGDGGIVFKNQTGGRLEEIEIGATGTVEIIGFENAKLIYRLRMSEASGS